MECVQLFRLPQSKHHERIHELATALIGSVAPICALSLRSTGDSVHGHVLQETSIVVVACGKCLKTRCQRVDGAIKAAVIIVWEYDLKFLV